MRLRPRRRRRRLRRAIVSVAALLGLVAGVVGTYAFSLAQTFESTEKIANAFPLEQTRPERLPQEVAASQNILLLGSDTRRELGSSLDGAKGALADTIMVVNISADRENVQVMSIMRDSWVEIPGRGNAKVNAALAYGGVPLVMETVENLIDVRIDHVAIVDFEGFKGITDALGGVTVDNEVAFSSVGVRFAKGPVILNGEDALTYVRARMSFRDGDYQRVRNQQLFIRAVLKETLSRETLANPATIASLVGAVAPFMAVDEGLNSGYAAGLGLELRDIRADDVKFFTMPTLGTGRESGQSIVRVDFEELEIIRGHFRADTLDDYEAKVQTTG